MKDIIVVALICLAAACSHNSMPSATPVVNTEIQNDQGNTILIGHCSLNRLYNAPYNEWFKKSYDEYAVDTAVVNNLKPLLADAVIEIFLGSWCGDSKREVPRMIKILEAASVDTARIHLIFVDNSTAHYKQSPQHEEYRKNIHRVPTFIFYTNKKETGRIVEYPVVSLEKDMLSIIQGNTYRPHYASIRYWQQQVKHGNRHLPDTLLQTIAATVKPMSEGVRDFNAYGYVLLAQKKVTEAINVFRLNTLLFPGIAAVYDSLGEAYYISGNKAEARLNYEKALSLNPGEPGILKMLEKLN